MKKIICMILTVAMLLTITAVAESGFAGGNGTKEDPWQIATAEQLNLIREDLTAHYVLIADVDLSGYENWEPIGAFQSLSTRQRMRRFHIPIMPSRARLTERDTPSPT